MNGRKSVIGITASLLLLSLMFCASGFTAQPAPKGKTTASTKTGGKKPFVIQETYREQKPYEDERGIVGLDMLIEPNHYPVVQRIFKGTPAYTEGVRMGDTILAINGVRAIDKSLWEVDQLISDVPGDVVSLTLLRDGKLKRINLTVMPISEANATVKNSFSGLVP